MRREWMLLALRFLIGECPNSEYMPLQCVLTSEDLPKKYLHQKKSNGAYKLTLEGKRVLILGGTSGIGLAVAEAAKAEGSDVVVVSSKQSRVDAALTLLGKGAEGYVANLSDERAVEALFGNGPV